MHEVILSEDLAKVWDRLEAEIKSGRKTNEPEFKALKKGIDQLTENYERGIHIPRKYPIFKYYSEKYGVDNLWKLDTSARWRLIYTLTKENIKIIAFVLDMLDHKTYDKLGGYHTT